MIGTLEDLTALFRRADVESTINAIRQAVESLKAFEEHHDQTLAAEQKRRIAELKNSLPGVIFQARAFRNHRWVDTKGTDHGEGAWRHQPYAVLNGLFIIDIDHVEDPRGLWQDLRRRNVMSSPRFLTAML